VNRVTVKCSRCGKVWGRFERRPTGIVYLSADGTETPLAVVAVLDGGCRCPHAVAAISTMPTDAEVVAALEHAATDHRNVTLMVPRPS